MSLKLKIIRDFRQLLTSPAKFLNFCQRVDHALTNNTHLTEALLALLKQFSEQVVILDPLYHQALDRAKSVIRERDRVIHEVAELLEQIASALESTFVLDPEVLQTTGFTVTQERRSTPRPRKPVMASQDFSVLGIGGRKALAKASTVPGGILQEIHINLKDPSVDEDWFHKAIFHGPKEMMRENLEQGNTFFRMRHHGPEGAGPWSAVVTITIT